MSTYTQYEIGILVICHDEHRFLGAAFTGCRIEAHRNLCLAARRYCVVEPTNVGPSDLYHFCYLEGGSSDILDDETVNVLLPIGQIAKIIKPLRDLCQGPAWGLQTRAVS